MIKNFKDVFHAIKLENWCQVDELDLSDNELLNLQNIVKSWKTPESINAIVVLYDYYGLIVPDDLLKKILTNDLNLAMEVYNGGIRDTCQRSLLVDSVLRHIGVRCWPMMGEGEDTYAKFLTELKEVSMIHGIIIQE